MALCERLGILLALWMVCLAGGPLAQAQSVPEVITYQGTLADADGNPVTDPIRLDIAFYDEEEGGDPLGGWTERHDDVPVTEGRFSVLVGSVNPDPLPDQVLNTDPVFLDVQVNGEPLDRVRLGSTFFALQAARAGQADQAASVAAGAAVQSLNGLAGAVTLGAGDNVTISQNGNELTIAATDTGLPAVTRDETLAGDGTATAPLGLADAAVTPAKLADGAAVRHLAVTDGEGTALGGLTDSLTLRAGDNVTLAADAANGIVTVSAEVPEGGLSSVSSNGTLAGDGTSEAPLRLADESVTAGKIANGTVVRSLTAQDNEGNTRATVTDDVALREGDRIVLGQQSGAITISIADEVPSEDEVLTSVSSDGTLAGDGTAASPLSLERNAVTSANIFDGEVKSDDIGPEAVTEAKILDGAVTVSKLSPQVPDGGEDRVLTYLVDSGEMAWQEMGVLNSSLRWKENVQPLEHPVDLVEQLRGVRYTWAETGEADVGVLAEEVAAVLPELVAFDADGQARGVQYAKLVSVLIEAIKAQQTELETAQQKAAALEERVARLERLILQQSKGSGAKASSSNRP